MTKYATLVASVVDVISYDPEREWIPPAYGEPDPDTGNRELLHDGHFGDALPPWIAVADEVFPGFVRTDDGSFLPPVPAAVDLQTLKVSLKRIVDVSAETERRKYITSGSGQAMTYMQKSDEAARYLAAADPDPASFPLLAAEVGITAPSIGEVATIVNAAYAQWQLIGAAIEAVRLGTKAAIDAAEVADAARAAADAAAWP